MRILVIQLARFGDIYQTWPVVRSLKRKHPEAKVEMMVRERYSAAALNHPDLDQVHIFPTKDILEPFYKSSHVEENTEIGLSRLQNVIDSCLQGGSFDQIINLTFSPVSSYLSALLASEPTSVRGYCRHNDGFLCLPDDSSAYFYAQVGVGLSSRLHLVDVFAAVADTTLEERDFDFREDLGDLSSDTAGYVVFHVGASRQEKALPPKAWDDILKGFLKTRRESIYLVGTANEKLPFPWLQNELRVVDLCGRTTLDDMFPLLGKAKALVAADSVMVQIANLVGTPVLNVSFPSVNFWETGPRTDHSRVLTFADPLTVEGLRVRQEIVKLISDEPAGEGVYTYSATSLQKYQPNTDPFEAHKDFQWRLVKAMYLGYEYPVLDDMNVALAFQRLQELSVLGLEQIDRIEEQPEDSVATGILDEIDHLAQKLSSLCPPCSPLVRWFLAEKSRIGPGSFQQVLLKTRNIFEQLLTVTRLYSLRSELQEDLPRGGLEWK